MEWAGLTAAYFVAGKFGLMLASIHASASPVWPPTGIALAAFLIMGARVWPAVFLGAFLVNASTAGSLLTSLAIATGNTLEGLLGAFLVRRFANGRYAFDHPQHLFMFTVLAGMVSTVVSPTIGVTTLELGGFADWAAYGPIWLTWWLGDFAGALIVTPLLVLWINDGRLRWSTRRSLEAAVLLTLLIVIGLTVFCEWLPSHVKTYPLTFLMYPLLIWAAFRFGQREISLAIAILSGFAIWGTLHHLGPFVAKTPNLSLLLLQAFMAVSSVTSLALASVVSERRRAETELQRAHDELETRVKERTAELASTNEALRVEITDRLRADAELRNQTRVLESILESIADGVVVAGHEGKFLVFNAAAEQILGTGLTQAPPEEWARQYSCYLPDGRPCPTEQLPLVRAMHGEAVDDQELVIRNPQKRDEVHVSVNARPLRLKHDSGLVVGGVVVFRDITDRKRSEKKLQQTNKLLVEEQRALFEALVKVKKAHRELQATQLQLIQAEKLESVGRLAAGVAHEVKNPLATLLIGIDHLADHFQHDGNGVSSLLQDMRHAVKRADTVIRGLLDFSSTKSLTLTPEDLHAVIEASLTLVKHELDRNHVSVIKEFSSSLPAVQLDRTKIEQVFINLFLNAIQAMPEGGTLRIGTQTRRLPAADGVAVRRKSDRFGMSSRAIVAEIDDTGPGIPPDKLPKVFDPFFTTKPTGQGTGLGLTVAKKIMELHRGAAAITNRPEGGVRVTLLFNMGGGDAQHGKEAHSAH
jgi:signal transduction histidine kinase